MRTPRLCPFAGDVADDEAEALVAEIQ